MDTTMIRLIAAVLAVIVLATIVYRRNSKSSI